VRPLVVPNITESVGRVIKTVRLEGQSEPVAVKQPIGRDARLLLWVERFVPTLNGFALRFSRRIETDFISSDGTADAKSRIPDILVIGPDGKPVRGSIVMDDDGKGFRFVIAGDSPSHGVYEVTLRSGLEGFHSFFGNLDGNRDGRPGGDFKQQFEIGPAADGNARGPDRVNSAPQASSASSGYNLPLYMNSQGDVQSLSFSVKTSPGGIDITGASLHRSMPTGSTLTMSESGDGILDFSIRSPQPLPAGRLLVAHLIANETATASDNADETARIDNAGAAPASDARQPAHHYAATHQDAVAIDFDGAFHGFALAGAVAFAEPALRGKQTQPRKNWQADVIGRGRSGGVDPNRSLRIRLDA
jgi:hypothetical protein